MKKWFSWVFFYGELTNTKIWRNFYTNKQMENIWNVFLK